MKHFIATNWFKLMTGTSILIFALAFFIFVLQYNVAKAGVTGNNKQTDQQQSLWIVAKGNSIYQVTWDRVFKKYECKKVCD